MTIVIETVVLGLMYNCCAKVAVPGAGRHYYGRVTAASLRATYGFGIDFVSKIRNLTVKPLLIKP